jgi:hypothetical protein
MMKQLTRQYSGEFSNWIIPFGNKAAMDGDVECISHINPNECGLQAEPPILCYPALLKSNLALTQMIVAIIAFDCSKNLDIASDRSTW